MPDTPEQHDHTADLRRQAIDAVLEGVKREAEVGGDAGALRLAEAYAWLVSTNQPH
jgi:hypothetical protein